MIPKYTPKRIPSHSQTFIRYTLCILCILFEICGLKASNSSLSASSTQSAENKTADKPLFRDPIYDGAADPVVIWNRREKKWFMFYTNRRANVPNTDGVSWVHGTPIGIAESEDNGATWKYRGKAEIGYGKEEYSFWAPEVVEYNGIYHMFLTVVPGTFPDWNAPRDIVHLTSTDLLRWTYRSTLPLSSHRVIDACVFRRPNGTWRLWYNNETDGKSIYYADSPDLFAWEDRGKVIGDQPGEGPKVFFWKDRYWMVVDVWDGLGIYRSDDLKDWRRQEGNLLQVPGKGADDQVKGGHPDVVVCEERAYLFYFTHPGRTRSTVKAEEKDLRRSSIQVAELQFRDGQILCDRDQPVAIQLKPQERGGRKDRPARSVRSIPHLEKRGSVTQLIVEDKPFLVLGGELHNSSSSSLDYMRPIWQALADMNLNTVLAAVTWEQFEPEEGKYDFSLVDGLVREARRRDLKLVLLWFGSWKNSTSRYAADWVKTDDRRFPRVKNREGKSLEILSALYEETRLADTRAFTQFMRHLQEIDGQDHTVLMIQVQNEVGILGATRDFSDAANLAYEQAVPRELLNYLDKNRNLLLPELDKIWRAAGQRTSGTWEEVFGKGQATDEIFTAWNYARFLGSMAEAGKKEYALPLFVNAWLIQPEDKAPGDYPSGGPVAPMHDIWRAGAPQIDMLCPDVYLRDFPGILSEYSRSGNPVFIPESFGDAGGIANAFYAVGQQGAIGYSPFGIDSALRLNTMTGAAGTPAAGELKSRPFSQGYALLQQLAPLILEHQAKGSIGAAWLSGERQSQKVKLGGFILEFSPWRNMRTGKKAEMAYGLAMALSADEFLVAGSDLQVTFTPDTPGPEIAGILSVEEGRMENGRWVPGRRLNGDEVQLRYDLSLAAAEGQSGAGLRFSSGSPTIQRVRLYRYR